MKRIGNREVCKVHNYPFGDRNVAYITFPGIESTGIVKQLFSTRAGGVSEGEFGEMNLSYTRGDRKECVDENFSRIAQILDIQMNQFVCTDQTHTTNVRVVTKEDMGKGVVIPKDYTDIDGLITNEPGIVLSTFYADCVPLYIVDPIHKAIGLSHSGWRGTVQRMGKVTLDAMNREYGTNARDVYVAIGPSICQSCYEVSEDVAMQFIDEFGNRGDRLVYRKENGKYQLNLHEANRIVFQETGVLEEHLEITDLCTCCNADFLHSHRASHGRRGNLGAFLALK